MRRGLLAGLMIGAFALFGGHAAHAAGDAPNIPDQHWQHEGVFGSFDRGELQRGFQVFQEVCSACHSLQYIAFRNLVEIGFTEEEAKAIAAEYDVEDGPDDEGEMFDRPARLSDYWPAPFANDNEARASNGWRAAARSLAHHQGARGRRGLRLRADDRLRGRCTRGDGTRGQHELQPLLPGQQIAMVAPLYDEAVEYVDGTPMTLEQHARDVTAFLAWTAEPELEERKQTGLKVLIFVFVLTAVLFVIYRRVWAKLH